MENSPDAELVESRHVTTHPSSDERAPRFRPARCVEGAALGSADRRANAAHGAGDGGGRPGLPLRVHASPISGSGAGGRVRFCTARIPSPTLSMMLRSGPPDAGAAALWIWVRSYAKPARLVCRNPAETVSARSIRPMPDDWRRQPPRSMSPSTFRPRRSGQSIGCPAESILDPAEDARGDKHDRGDRAYRNNQNQPRSVVDRQRNPVAERRLRRRSRASAPGC